MVIFWSTALSLWEVSGLWVPAGPKQLLAFSLWFRPTSDSHAATWTTFNVNTTCWWHESTCSACCVDCISNKSYLCPALLRLFSCSLSDWRRLTGEGQGRQPQVSLLSAPLSASRAGAGVDLCYQLNNANVLYCGALIKLFTSNTTEFIFTVLKIQIWLLLKYRCCKNSLIKWN